MAFSRYRWAWLRDDVVRVVRTGDYADAARFTAPGATSLVAVAGGAFLAQGRERLFRISPLDRRPRTFAKVPRLGPTRLFPSVQDSERLWVHFDGSDRLWEFGLNEEYELTTRRDPQAPVPMLPQLGESSLPGFDGRALTVLRDDSVVYSRDDGLGRRYPQGRLERIPVDWGGAGVWSLLPGNAVQELWVATARQLVKISLHAADRGRVSREYSLPNQTLAVASTRHRIAWLSMADLRAGRYRIDVRSLVSELSWEVWGDVAAARARQELQPELRLAPTQNLLSLWLGEAQLVDYERDRVVRIWRSEAATSPTEIFSADAARN